MGFDTFTTDTNFKFYNERGEIMIVDIGRTCSGLHSVAIFISAFTSYVFVTFRQLDFKLLFYIFLGILMSYIANLLRMTIIILLMLKTILAIKYTAALIYLKIIISWI